MRPAPTIFVAGHRGMVGSAIVRQLLAAGHPDGRIVTRTHEELDLTEQSAVRRFFAEERPEQVYLAAAKVGGIWANNAYRADFLYLNLMIEANVIDAAFRNGVGKLLFLGSSCIYPRLAEQPIREGAFLTGPLEETNEPYAIAKIAGIEMCDSYSRQHGVDYRSVMPTNLYGPGDNYHPENSHVVPALIRRFHEAKVANAASVTVWGTGTPRREFLHVDDMAAASVHVMNLDRTAFERQTPSARRFLNVGYGEDVSIADLARTVAVVVGYQGELAFDPSRPDGTPRKLMDSSALRGMGWRPRIDLRAGLEQSYRDFLEHHA